MKHFILLSLVVMAAAWPEGRPNCPVAGDWEDPPATDSLVAAVAENAANETVLEVTFNSTGENYNGTTHLEDKQTGALKVSGRENDTLLLHLLCVNDVLWVMQTPLNDSPRMMRMFAFRRRAPPPPPALQDTSPNTKSTTRDASSPSSSSSSSQLPVPEFILVNISLPKREEDDHVLMGDYKRSEGPPR